METAPSTTWSVFSVSQEWRAFQPVSRYPTTTGSSSQLRQNAVNEGNLFPDPAHDLNSVNLQIFGNTAGTPGATTMQGFIQSYFAETNNQADSLHVVDCFKSPTLPVLAALPTASACATTGLPPCPALPAKPGLRPLWNLVRHLHHEPTHRYLEAEQVDLSKAGQYRHSGQDLFLDRELDIHLDHLRPTRVFRFNHPVFDAAASVKRRNNQQPGQRSHSAEGRGRGFRSG
jgi:hypothetical protein